MLTAFHGDPLNAYNSKSNIWKSNVLYSRVFNERTSAMHIVFVYSLYKVLDDYKRLLIDKDKQNTITDAEKEQLEFFQHRGATMVATTAIASCLEIILGRQIPDLFKLSFGAISPGYATAIWTEILEPLVALISQLRPAVENGLKGQEITASAIGTFRALVNATKSANHKIYEDFKAKVVVS